MELIYGLHQPLRIYDSLDKKNSNRLNCVKSFSLYSSNRRLLPFQIKENESLQYITSIILVRSKDGANQLEMIGYIPSSDLDKISLDNSDVLIHYGSSDLSFFIPNEGEYYLRITDGNKVWYSEDFKVRNFDPDDITTSACVKTKIEYWDTCDVGDIFYRTETLSGKQYKNIIFTDLEIFKPGVSFYEEGEENADRTFEVDIKRAQKNYNIEGLFPEFMIDALSVLCLHVLQTSVVQITNQYGMTQNAINVNIDDPVWEDDFGTIARTTLSFNTDYRVKKNCCSEVEDIYRYCFRDPDSFLTLVDYGSSEYNNFEFFNSETQHIEDFQDGDYIMINTSGIYDLKMYENGTYLDIPEIVYLGKTFLDTNGFNSGDEDVYYYYSGSSVTGYKNKSAKYTNSVHNENTWYAKSDCWENCTVQMRAQVEHTELVLAQVSGSVFSNTGVYYDIPPGTQYVYARYLSGNCILDNSKYIYFENGGINYMQIGTSFVIRGSSDTIDNSQQF